MAFKTKLLERMKGSWTICKLLVWNSCRKCTWGFLSMSVSDTKRTKRSPPAARCRWLRTNCAVPGYSDFLKYVILTKSWYSAHWVSIFIQFSRWYKLAAFLCWFHKAVIWLAPPNDCFDDHINATLVCVIPKSSCEVGILLSRTSAFSGLVPLQLPLGRDQCLVNPFPERTYRSGPFSGPTSNLLKRCDAPPALWRHCFLPDPRPSTEFKNTTVSQKSINCCFDSL